MPDPTPSKSQVVIDVEYCGLNHLDIWARKGVAGKKIKLPHVCGCDIVGKVAGRWVMVYPGISCGHCAHCRSGRENLCSQFAIIGGLSDYDGGYAEKVSVPKANIIRLPNTLKPETAATLSVSYLTAWNMLHTNEAERNKTILVYGATSGVGMATIQLAKALGAFVITTVSTDSKSLFAKKIGADKVLDRTAGDIAKQVASICDGVDIVVDHVGAATWGTSIACLKSGGRMAVCGTTSGNEANVPIRTFYTKQITMTGALLGSKAQLAKLLRFVIGKNIQPAIDSVVPLECAAAAQAKMEDSLHSGKIVLRCR